MSATKAIASSGPHRSTARSSIPSRSHEALAALLEPSHDAATIEADGQHGDERVETILVAPERLHLVEKLSTAGHGDRRKNDGSGSGGKWIAGPSAAPFTVRRDTRSSETLRSR